MGIPVVVAGNGYGTPVTIATNGYGLPVEVAANGYGMPVVLVASGGMPVVGTFGPDVTAPLAVSFSPTDNATGVNTATLLIVTFDSLVTLGTGNVTLKKTSDNSTVEAWNVATEAGTGAGQVSVEFSTQLTMRLTTSIAGGIEYYVIWDANVVKDIASNPVAAQASTTLWSFTTAGAGYDAATEAIAAAFTTPPTTARKNLIDACVVALKAAGVWTKLDCMYMLAAADSQAAKINWKSPGTFNCTEVSAPVFTADRGFNPVTGTKYLDSGYIPGTHKIAYAQDSASVHLWNNTATRADAQCMIGFRDGSCIVALNPWNAGADNANVGLHSSPVNALNVGGPADGLFTLNRTAAANYTLSRNGVSVGTQASASVALGVTATMKILYDGTYTTNREAAFGAWGGGLNSTEVTALYNALRAYMTGVGIP